MKDSSAPSTQTIGPPKLGKATVNRWIVGIVVIGIIVVGGLVSLIYFTNAQVSSRNFSYNFFRLGSQQPYNSISISDVDGTVSFTQWTRDTILINGTITAKGLGSSLSVVNISNSSDNGNILFEAIFPVNPGFFFSQSYSAKINVYVPSSVRFHSVQVSNVNGGVRIASLNATDVSVVTVNGAVAVDCIYCMNITAMSTNGNIATTFAVPLTSGLFNITSTNANVAFTLPASSSFKAVARVENGNAGSIQVIGFIGATSATTYLNQTFGSGSADVVLSSVNGVITITGT